MIFCVEALLCFMLLVVAVLPSVTLFSLAKVVEVFFVFCISLRSGWSDR